MTDFGEIGLVNGRMAWPFEEMEVGDEFVVSKDVKPVPAVRSAVYMAKLRHRKNFETEQVGDYTLVRMLADGEVAKPGPKGEAQLVGGDGEDHLGVLQLAEEGRTKWPFRDMKPGQYFHVHHEDKHPEAVRNYAMVTAAKLSIPLSVTADDPEMPHHARVEYVKHGRRLRKNEPDSPDMLWEKMHKHLERYGVHLGTLDIWSGRETFVPIDWNEKPPLEWYSISGADGEIDHVIQITDEGIRGWMVKKGTTVKQFLANRETFDIFESQKKRMDKQQEERERAILMEKMRKDIEKEAAARLMED